MDLQVFFNFKISFIFLTIFIIFTSSMTTSLAVSSKFNTCVTQNCGKGPNISYPFWIPQQQESYCGSPGFNLTCSNKNPIITISNDEYIVKDIFYANNSFLLANANLYDDNNSCPIPLHNFSIDGTPFSYSDAYMDLYFFLNCTFPCEDATYLVSCASNATQYSFAIFHTQRLKRENYSVETCQAVVTAGVEGHSIPILLAMTYKDILKKGFVLDWSADNCNNCKKSGGSCGSLSNEFNCFWDDQTHLKTCDFGRKRNLRLILSTVIVVTFVAGIGILITIVFCFRRKIKFIVWRKTEKDHIVETFLTNHGPLIPKRYYYLDVKKMTNSFKVKLGHGGYGCVYRGMLCNGTLVAVKVLNESKGNGEEFFNEVASISRTSHVNVVTLLGYCSEGPKRALIYKFMPNGSLDKYIYNGNSLTERQLGLEKLHPVAIGIARGLEYLHRGCNTRILHFDIKPHNILLDEDFCPKISDFGLARLCPRKESNMSMITTRGTIGYIAPEVFCRNFGGVSHKSDVYSYGMMVLEMVGGRKNNNVGVDHTSEIYFPHWIYKQLELDELGLHGIVNEKESERTRKMVIVSLWCIQTDPSSRLSMTRVVEMLEGSVESLAMPPKPFLFSPLRSQADSSTIEITQDYDL